MYKQQNNGGGGGIVSNELYYSRRLPEVSSPAPRHGRSLDALSKLEAVALAKG